MSGSVIFASSRLRELGRAHYGYFIDWPAGRGASTGGDVARRRIGVSGSGTYTITFKAGSWAFGRVEIDAAITFPILGRRTTRPWPM